MLTAQQILDFMKETAYKPMTYQELEKHFEIDDASSFKAFLKTLNELEQDGHIIRTRSDRYGVPERMNLLRGRLQAHAKGFGFLIPEETDHPDVYIHANDLQSAMNGDTILVRVTNRGHDGARMEGEIVRIVKRAIEQVVGVFQNNDSFGFVIPDDRRINRDIFIPREAIGGAVSGQKVVVRITNYPEGRAAAQGEVVEILGHKDDPGVDILSVIRKHQLPEAFPDEVMEEAEAAPESITEEEIISQGRRDLRGQNIVTIDGEDAKDLDDAVYVERLPNGNYKLGVHIADVGYYVKEGSALDREAYARGCSVYLVDRVIPMLPHRLSNGICSLHPHVDRLTLSCEMEFDAQAKIVKHDIFTSVIRSVERMTYNNVRKIVEDEDPELLERYAYLVDSFKLMKELAMKLRGKRMRRGAIDFDFQESKVIVDAEGKAVDIVKRERSVAEQIIEEFMLVANETVAEHFHWLRVPFLYRIHEDPDSEKLLNFMSFAANFGYAIRGKGNSVHPRALQTLLEEIEGTREQTVISTMMLRSMRQAKYDAESTGHFGLAAEYYSHFTSPIRRYPDLIIHRVIREVMENGGSLTDKRHEQLSARMPDIAQQSSERERVAVDAERDTEQMKKAEYMLDKVGEEFDGIISSVTSFGMFIELDNTVEGLIRLSDLTDDYYHFHEQQMMLLGERTARMFRIGDQVRILVARVNMEEHTIDFELAGETPRFGRREGREFGFERAKRGRRGDDRGPAARGGRGSDGGRRGAGSPGSDARGGAAHGGQGNRDGDRRGTGSRGNDARGGAARGGQGNRDGGRNGAGSRGNDARGGAPRGGRSGRGGDAQGGYGRSEHDERGRNGADRGSGEVQPNEAGYSEEQWYNQGEWRELNKTGRHRRGRKEDVQNPYSRSSKPANRGKGGITFGSKDAEREGGRGPKDATAGDDHANWVDRIVSDAEQEVRSNRFDFGSGKGGYGRPNSGSSASGNRERHGGSGGDYRSSRGQLGGGKRGRRSTSESGVFVGESSPQARGNRGGAEQAGQKRGKANNKTSRFVRKKR